MAGVQHYSALLLKDTVGDKGAWLFGRKKENVLRGSLLVGITTKDTPTDGKPAYNFKAANDDILMFCSEQDLAPLTNREFDLLAGIKSPGARYDVFINDILELGIILRVNDKVFVALPPLGHETSRGIVRWTGYLPNDRGEGIHFGVEILEEQHRGKGSTNGFFRGQQLFTCDHNCGLVVSLDKLAPTADRVIKRAEATQSVEPPKTIASRLGLVKSNETQHSSSSRTRLGVSAGTRSQAQENISSQFKIGDHVIAYSKDQIPIHGVVKWTGEVSVATGGNINAVGIETNVPVHKEDFSVTFPTYVRTFKCDNSRHGKVVLPESMVQLETKLAQKKHSKEHEEILRHLEQKEQKMLCEAKLKKYLNPSEQEKLIREYNQQRDEKIRDKKLEAVNNVDSTSQQDIPKSSIPRQFSTQERVKSTTFTGLEKSHMYDVIIPHSNSAGNLLQQQPQHIIPPANVHVQEEAILREAKIESRAFDRAEQQRMLQKYKLQRDRDIQRKIEGGGTCSIPGSGSSQHRSGTSVDRPAPDQSNMPLQSNSRAFFPPRNDSMLKNLTMNSRVQFSDPPRYGVIRWIGDLPQVSGLIAGVELEKDMEGCEDGFWRGKRYFSCEFGRAFFSPVFNLKPDQRVVTSAGQTPPMIHAPNVPALGYQHPPQGTTHGYREPTHGSSTEAKFESYFEGCTDGTAKFPRLFSTPVSKEKLLESEKKELQQRLKELQQKLEEQQQRVEELTHENAQCIELADQQKHQLMQQIELQGRENENQLATKEERIKQLEIDLQQKVDSASESSVSRFTKVQIPRQDQDSWNVQRREVVIQQELGHGAWGSVYKGVFRGRQVAVKKAHEEILHETTIDQLIREIRIMAHVQHPNLVRLVAAVVDEGVERRTESPLVVLELMETNLRSTSRKYDFQRGTLLSIFHDVAYALHYLHEHQEPIIHRDVSAPNVLLQRIYQDIWRAKLSDFGSANLAKHCKTVAPGAIIYSAPETFPNIDPPPKQTTKIDVYSYGYLLVESIAKKMPSHDKRDTMLSTVKEVWAPMYYLIIACTNKEPERRLTMSQVLERLHSLSNE